MRIFSVKGALAASAAATMIFLGAAPASATFTWSGTLHEPHRGSVAVDFAKEGETCPGVSENEDGWHFVTRGTTNFVKLEATFEKAGTIELTTFGPPSDKHAYIATPVGDVLVDATATLKGHNKKQNTFLLSHACPGTEESGENGGTGDTGDTTEGTTGDTTEGSTGDSTEGQTSEGSTGDTGDTTEGQTSEGSTGDTGDSTEGTTGDTTEGSTGDEGTEGTTGDDAEATTGGVTPDGGSETPDLANTGSNTPVIGASVLAAALLGVGGYMAMRRRNAAGRA
ncbi:hypothetical protein GCM10027160_24410 [Streptomyces calidiresistens]|uniref:LPXTG cell wall anchor domain-containing protein n=1 Tax=Streptomyces calidiresistens TaxID=1485586 RepID=A0A7W3XXS9_9ACTN|nr:LPXTG cell wall anchor domain-containing protein [Streptomyces calidiresistens]MBB0231264.1 LPXTG cell wall anchor domain-containing protein [Streptomyces calidiresistens]